LSDSNSISELPFEREEGYAVRWALRNGSPVPEGAALEFLVASLRPMLGPEPGEIVGIAPDVITASPEPAELFTISDTAGNPAAPVAMPPEKWLVPASQSFPIVGRGFTLAQFAAYLQKFDEGSLTWDPDFVTIHHTAVPNLGQRPEGFVEQHMLNMRGYYRGLGWRSGPHLFVDDHKVWIFTPLSDRGVHARSFNAHGIGIEMLGDYDYPAQGEPMDNAFTGRGKKVIANAQAVTAMLNLKFGFSADSLEFHRDDPKTSKTCPGEQIDKSDFERAVMGLMLANNGVI